MGDSSILWGLLVAILATIILSPLQLHATQSNPSYYRAKGREEIHDECNAKHRVKTPDTQKEAQARHTSDFCTTSDSPYARICRIKSMSDQENASWAAWNQSHPDDQVSFEVISMIVPVTTAYTDYDNVWDRKERATSVNLVNLYVDPKTKRIVRFTEERRDKLAKNGKFQERPRGIEQDDTNFIDPKLKWPLGDSRDHFVSSQRLQGENIDEMSSYYNHRLNEIFSAADAHGCDFAQAHNQAVRYANDEMAKPLDDFKNCEGFAYKCDKKSSSEECPSAMPETGFPKEAHACYDELIKANQNFNLQLMQIFRTRAQRTQASIIATTQGLNDFNNFDIGPSKQNNNCGSDHEAALLREGLEQQANLAENDDELKKVIAKAEGLISSGRLNKNDDATATTMAAIKKNLGDTERYKRAIQIRSETEWLTTRQTFLDTIEAAWHRRRIERTVSPIGKVEQSASLDAVLNRNRVLGTVGEKKAAKLYDHFKASAGKLGLDLKELEKLERMPLHYEAPAAFRKIQKAVLQIEKGGAAGKLIMGSGNDSILSKVRDAKLETLKILHEKLGDFTAMCDKASEIYDDDVIYDDGNSLWRDPALLESMLRQNYKNLKGRELDQFKFVYCANTDSHIRTQRHRGYALAGAALVLSAVPIAGKAAGVAAIEFLAAGAITAGAVTTAAIAGGEAYSQYLHSEMIDGSYSAGIAGNAEKRDAQESFESTRNGTVVAVALTGLQARGFAQLVKISKDSGRLVAPSEIAFVKDVKKAEEMGLLTRSQARQLIDTKHACPKGDCGDSYLKLGSLVDENEKRMVKLAAEAKKRIEAENAARNVKQSRATDPGEDIKLTRSIGSNDDSAATGADSARGMARTAKRASAAKTSDDALMGKATGGFNGKATGDQRIKYTRPKDAANPEQHVRANYGEEPISVGSGGFNTVWTTPSRTGKEVIKSMRTHVAKPTGYLNSAYKSVLRILGRPLKPGPKELMELSDGEISALMNRDMNMMRQVLAKKGIPHAKLLSSHAEHERGLRRFEFLNGPTEEEMLQNPEIRKMLLKGELKDFDELHMMVKNASADAKKINEQIGLRFSAKDAYTNTRVAKEIDDGPGNVFATNAKLNPSEVALSPGGKLITVTVTRGNQPVTFYLDSKNLGAKLGDW